MKLFEKIFFLVFIFLFLFSSVYAEELKVTEEHPFYLDNKWVSAKDLKPGDEFKTIDGKTAVVKKVTLVEPEKPFWVYNLEVPFYNNFVVGPFGLIVHNSNKATLSPSEYAKKGVEIPKPHRDHTPSYNREQADEWVESALTDETIKAKIRQEVRDVRRTIVDNVERVSYDQFEQELKVAVDKFNTHIDDEPYVVVIMANGGSEQWAYEIASQWLKNKPEGFAYIKSGYSRSSEDVEQSLQPFFDKGIRKVVVFDDAAYSGTGITEEAGFPVARQYQKFVEGKGGYDEQPMEYIAVVSRATDGATQKFYSSSILNNYKDLENTPELIAGGRMQSVGQVVNWDQLNPAVRKHLVKRGIDDSQTLIYYEHKVPDSLSLPEQVSDRIYTAHQSHMSARSYSHDLYEPYKLTSDFSEKWREVGKEASVFIQLLSSIVQLLR